jgi:hypothetical protein
MLHRSLRPLADRPPLALRDANPETADRYRQALARCPAGGWPKIGAAGFANGIVAEYPDYHLFQTQQIAVALASSRPKVPIP